MMFTKITEKLTINGVGKDIVFDGFDFTGNGYVEIKNAKSVTIRNCRIYGLNVEGAAKNYWLKVIGDIETQLVVEHCFFGKNPGTKGVMYNIIEPNAKLATGSSISHNYFTADSCTHNTFSAYGMMEGAELDICGNTFEVCAASVRIGVKGSPKCTINACNNTVLANDPRYGDADQGLLCIQPYGKSTTTFANMTINANDNVLPTEQVMYGCYYSADTPMTAETMPKMFVDGQPYEAAIYKY